MDIHFHSWSIFDPNFPSNHVTGRKNQTKNITPPIFNALFFVLPSFPGNIRANCNPAREPSGGNGWLGATPRVMRSLASLASIGRDESDYFGCLCLTRQRCHEDTRCGVCGSELGRDGVWCQVFSPQKSQFGLVLSVPAGTTVRGCFFFFWL